MSSNQAQRTKRRRGLSISAKLIIAIAICVAIVMVFFVLVVNQEMSNVILRQNDEILTSVTDSAVQETSAWVNATLAMLQTQKDTIEFENMTVEEIDQYVTHTVGSSDAYPAGLYVALPDGTLHHNSFHPGPEFDVFSRSWYISGEKAPVFQFGEVYFDEDSKSNVVGASGRIQDAEGNFLGVAAADVYLDGISGIVSDVTIEETGSIFLLDTATDIIIGHKDPALPGTVLSENADSMYADVDAMVQQGARGIQTVDDMYVCIQDVPNTSWVAVAYVPKTEVLASIRHMLLAMTAMSCIAVVAVWILVIIMVRRIIARPVRELTEAATRIADGEMDLKISYTSGDELGLLADNFNRVTMRLQDYRKHILDIASKLHQIANGDLTYSMEGEYVGEFARIKDSLLQISRSLNGTISHLRDASRDVSAGATQISHDAMTLSQGSTEQAAEVDSIAKYIASVSQNVSNIADGAQQVDELAGQVRNGLVASQDKMRNMTDVIVGINRQSTEIHKIVKTIEEIATQTNILALNAAVEAARAGTSGQGFAVVADEVRALAQRSADAAKETTTLLGQTVDAMTESVRVAEDTNASLSTVVEQADEMSTLVAQIADYTKIQAKDTSEISHGIREISEVSQNNVAAVEATAAASEELSGQAGVLKEMVDRFKVYDR